MSNYLMKYKGKYRVMAHIDKSTNDYPRNYLGKIETDDLYIPCKNDAQIYHYGHSTLVAYIPRIKYGYEIIRRLADAFCNIPYSRKSTEREPLDKIKAILVKNKYIWDILETDMEVEFKFNASNIDAVAKVMRAKTSGADISPFSVKNLPKRHYSIPAEDLALYKDITKQIPKSEVLSIGIITKRFLDDKVQKSKEYRTKDINECIKMERLGNKEFIHYIGFWKKYIDYLHKELGV